MQSDGSVCVADFIRSETLVDTAVAVWINKLSNMAQVSELKQSDAPVRRTLSVHPLFVLTTGSIATKRKGSYE